MLTCSLAPMLAVVIAILRLVAAADYPFQYRQVRAGRCRSAN
jgi:hypothetical protein